MDAKNNKTSSGEKKDKHYWFIDEFRSNGSKYTVFCYSDLKPDGSHHPAKVDVKREYHTKDGELKVYYLSLQGLAIRSLLDSLSKSVSVNEKFFGFGDVEGINVPSDLRDKDLE